MIKSKTESPMMRLKTLLLKLSKYTIDLKYQKGSEMHTSDALSRLHNFADTSDQKDIIPLNFLQHFTPQYICDAAQSGEDPKLQNTLKNASYQGVRAAN